MIGIQGYVMYYGMIIWYTKQRNWIEIQTNERSMETLISYLTLGESYTIDEGVVFDDRWTSQMGNMLKEKGIITVPYWMNNP